MEQSFSSDSVDVKALLKKALLNQASKEEIEILNSYPNQEELFEMQQDLIENDQDIKRIVDAQQQVQFQQEELEIQRLMKQNFTYMGAINKIKENQVTPQILQSGGKKILHFTDTEVNAKELRGRLENLLAQEGVNPKALLNGEKLPENMVLVHTGDLGPDLFDTKEFRMRAFSPDIVADQGRLEGEQREEFIALYKEMMDESGLTQEILDRSPRDQNEQQILQRFNFLLLGHIDPEFKTQEELEEFKEKRAKLHSHLEDAIQNHSMYHLQEHKKVYEQYGFDESNFIILSGNHDVPKNVEEVFSDSYIKEGETKNVRGISFNRPLGTATGNIYGPSLGRDIMGSNELIEQIPQMRYETQAFSELRDYVRYDLGFEYFDDKHIDELIKRSVMKTQLGIASTDLKALNDRIESEVRDEIKNRLDKIESTLDRDADIYLGHGDVTHPQYAGLEEIHLRKLLDDTDSIYLGGHQHGETTSRYNNSTYINPGASAQYNSGSVLLDSQNSLVAAKSFSINPQTQQFENNFRYKTEIASQSVNEGGGAAG